MEIDGSHKSQWESIKSNEKHAKLNGNQWKSMKVNGNQKQSMKTHVKKTMIVYEGQYKWMKNNKREMKSNMNL